MAIHHCMLPVTDSTRLCVAYMLLRTYSSTLTSTKACLGRGVDLTALLSMLRYEWVGESGKGAWEQIEVKSL